MHRPPKRRRPSTLRQVAFETVVRNVLSGATNINQIQKEGPLVADQVKKQVKRWANRSKRQSKLVQHYQKDVENYFNLHDPPRSRTKPLRPVPLYLLSGFGRLIESEMDNEFISKFRESKRKFQKVGKFDPRDYEEWVTYTFYLVKFHDEIFLSVYDYENEHIFSIRISETSYLH